MSSMEHQEVDLSKPQNQDLIWDLDSMARRELAERFIQLFENRLCVYSESVSQLYTNYNLHFPSEQGRKMVVLPNPYAFHDTLHGIEAVASPDASCAVEGDGSLNCHGYGSVVAVTATFGQCAAGWVLDKLATSSRQVKKITL